MKIPVGTKAGLKFTEAMEGTWRPTGGAERPMRFEAAIETHTPIRPLGTVAGRLSGRMWVDGVARGSLATGTIEVSPVAGRRIRYALDFSADDGTPLRFDGWKSIDWLRPVATWTTLPGTLYGADGAVVGTAVLRFPLRDTPALLGGAAPSRPAPERAGLDDRRWDGGPGRLEVWYDTFTDPVTTTGFWIHHELCAPTGSSGTERAELRGWVAVFPPDGPPVWERFGPAAAGAGRWFDTGRVRLEPGRRSGQAGDIAWDLELHDGSEPLFTFPRWAWRRAVLPGAQIVPSPTARFDGTVTVGSRRLQLAGARGAAARIYGHGNAARWAWLHADLGDGDVLEIVAATPHRPGLDRLAPLPLVRLRTDGSDWPAYPLRAALRFRCRISPNAWVVTGGVGNRRLRVTVTLPPERCVEVGYTDPDGTTATCVNSERADAHVVVEHRHADGRWRTGREWTLDGTAHAEVGRRP